MSLKDRIEQLLREQDVESKLRPASGEHGHFDGYTVEQLDNNSALVRCTLGAIGVPEGRRLNAMLEVCSAILADDGLLVERFDDDTGGYLVARKE